MCGCSKSSLDDLESPDEQLEPLDSLKYYTISELRQQYTMELESWKILAPLNAFHPVCVWKEVVYEIDNPQNYMIYRYTVDYVINRLEKEHYLYENSKLIGFVTEPDSLSNVYYRPVGEETPQLLYNFIEIENNSCGIYCNDQGFIYFKDMRIPRDIPFIGAGYHYDTAFTMYPDGNTVLSCIGSLSGILKHMNTPLKDGMCREVLLVYRVISDSPRYINLESPVVKYLPEDFWEEAWAKKKYDEYMAPKPA